MKHILFILLAALAVNLVSWRPVVKVNGTGQSKRSDSVLFYEQWKGIAAPIIAGTPTHFKNYADADLAPHQFQIVTVQATDSGTTTALQITCAPGDTTNPYSDRAEILVPIDSSGEELNIDKSWEGDSLFISFAIRLNRYWTFPVTQDTTHNTIMQLHMPTGDSAFTYISKPAIALNAFDFYMLKLHACEDKVENENFELSYPLINPACKRGQWTYFIIAIKFATSTTGFVKIYQKDQTVHYYTPVLSVENVCTLPYKVVDEDTIVPAMKWHTGQYRPKNETITNIDAITDFKFKVLKHW